MLAKIPDTELALHTVWVPMSGGTARHVRKARKRVDDPRGQHWWDEGGVAMAAWDRTLGLGRDAWDVYLVYGPDATWTAGDPPKPDFWMHQLWAPDDQPIAAPMLDTEVLSGELVARVEAARP